MATVTVSTDKTQFTIKDLAVSTAEVSLPFKEAMEWCKKNNGGSETSEAFRTLAENRETINEELKKNNLPILEGDYWTNEVDYESPNGYAVVARIDVREGEMMRTPRMQLRMCKVRAINNE